MSAYEVLVTSGAARDLEDIYDYICSTASVESADHVLDKIVDAMERLSNLPERGSRPAELAEIGVDDFREVLFKPYRVIYRVAQSKVFVYVIADGRRDMQALLLRRLIRP